MDLKRFDEIDGLDVLKRLSREESIYNTQGNELYIDDCKMWMSNGELTGVVNITIADILSGKWFIKKPFDIRAEMLARPNEWVGAYQAPSSNWYKVGFDHFEMVAISTSMANNGTSTNYYEDDVLPVVGNWFEKCIPIEDVPKGEL